MGQRRSAVLRIWRRHRLLTVMLAGLFLPAIALTQQPCTSGIRVEGTISDPTGALVAGAQIVSEDGRRTTTDGAGRFVLPCVPSAAASITVQAGGFAPAVAQARAPLGGTAHLNLRLAIASVQTDVQGNADAAGVDTDSGTDTTTLNSAEVQRLADDPDDFLRQLQQLAAASGSDPNAASIKVDGFQNGSALPPKSSIASIRVNPDLFSSQYEWPPWGGGVIEITTKPGAPTYHGALFFTDRDHEAWRFPCFLSDQQSQVCGGHQHHNDEQNDHYVYSEFLYSCDQKIQHAFLSPRSLENRSLTRN